jgi:hypothetical protein
MTLHRAEKVDFESVGGAGKRFYDEQLSLKTGAGKFEALFAKICGMTLLASRHSSQISEYVS